MGTKKLDVSAQRTELINHIRGLLERAMQEALSEMNRKIDQEFDTKSEFEKYSRARIMLNDFDDWIADSEDE